MSWLAGLRESWVPEHASGEKWIEEGQAAGEIRQQSGQRTEHLGNAAQAGIERDAVNSVLSGAEADVEVAVGDVVRYVDVARPTNVLTVQITEGGKEVTLGVGNDSDPIARALVSAVVGDEGQVRSDGGTSRTFKVLDRNYKKGW